MPRLDSALAATGVFNQPLMLPAPPLHLQIMMAVRTAGSSGI